MSNCSVSNLDIDESLLTGEALPVSKSIEPIDKDSEDQIPVGDRVNLAFSSSVVTKGRGVGIVIGTGMETQVSISGL